MTKSTQIKTLLLIYIILVYKVNDNNDDIISNIDQPNNYLSPVDNCDLQKLMH